MLQLRLAPFAFGLLALAGCAGSAIDEEGRPGSARIVGEAVDPGRELAVVAGQSIYVPAYSHVYYSDSARPYQLAVTLSVRNTDRELPIVLESVRYHDSAGKLVRSYLKAPVELPPLATDEFYVRESDTTGGSGANFLVDWVAEHEVSAPVVEAVMIGTTGAQGISLICSGRVVGEHGSGRAP